VAWREDSFLTIREEGGSRRGARARRRFQYKSLHSRRVSLPRARACSSGALSPEKKEEPKPRPHPATASFGKQASADRAAELQNPQSAVPLHFRFPEFQIQLPTHRFSEPGSSPAKTPRKEARCGYECNYSCGVCRSCPAISERSSIHKDGNSLKDRHQQRLASRPPLRLGVFARESLPLRALGRVVFSRQGAKTPRREIMHPADR
jgi:hypothetical protein